MNDPRLLAKIFTALIFVVASAIAMAQSNNTSGQGQVNPDQSDIAATRAPLDPFPGGAGSYWVYEGVVRYEAPNNVAKEKKVRWQMSLERILRRDGATAAVVKGFPDDLAWSNGDAVVTESMFVRTDDGRLYRFESKTGSADQKFSDSQIPIQEIIDKGDLLFQWPPIVGAQPGGGNCPHRTDEMYCWVLTDPEQVSVRSIRGAPSASGTAYRLLYTTNPDQQAIEIVSGVGVTGYEYHHHGTVADSELRLVEVHLVEKK